MVWLLSELTRRCVDGGSGCEEVGSRQKKGRKFQSGWGAWGVSHMAGFAVRKNAKREP